MPVSLVALHYWAGAGHEFDLLRPLLPAGQRLLAPDLPGFGEQAAPAGFDYTVGSYGDWLVSLLARHQLTDYLLVGHSMGGKIALAVAARHPPGLRGLLLLAPSPPGPEPLTDAERAASLAAYGQTEEAEKTLARISAAPLPAAVRAQVVHDNLRTDPAAWSAWLTGGAREDLTALMPQLRVPCRLLVGSADRALGPAAQRQHTLPCLPAGTRLEEVPDAGHLLPLEAPNRVAVALAEFS